MNAAERLTQLSGQPGGTAAERLRRIAGVAGVAGAMLVAFSGLPSGSASGHLLSDKATVVQPTQNRLYGGGGGRPAFDQEIEMAVLKQAIEEDEIIVVALAKMIATGAFT